MKKYICYVCGYPKLTSPPWGEDGQTPNFEICDCCGVEFGYEDATEKGLEKYRQAWIDSGAKWFDNSKRPNEWSLKEQLKGINIELNKL